MCRFYSNPFSLMRSLHNKFRNNIIAISNLTGDPHCIVWISFFNSHKVLFHAIQSQWNSFISNIKDTMF